MPAIRRLLAAALVAAPIAHARAQDVPAPRWTAAVDSMMRAEMARARTPGAQLAVVENGRLVYTKGYGVADVESGRPVTDRTLFQIGSIAKTVTAALITQLAVEGTLDLQAPISRYVPELAGRRVGAVTMHQLLTHTAGWANFASPFGAHDDARLGEVFRAVTDTMMMTDPGRVYSYSNSGVAMAGYVAERVARRPFADLRDSVVLRRLGMPRATSRPLVAMTYDFSLGHMAGPDGAAAVVRPTPDNGVDRPAGFLYASAAELARLAVALMDGGMLDGQRVLPAEAVRAMTTGHVSIPDRQTERGGYGMDVDVVGGRRVWIANGSVVGMFASMRMWPDQKLAVLVFANRAMPEMPRPAVERVAHIVAGIAPPPPRPTYTAEREPTAAERAQLAGTYGVGPSTFEVAEANGALELRMGRTGLTYPVRLTSAGDRIVIPRPRAGDLVYLILRDPDGQVRFLYSGGRAFAKQR